MMVIENELIIMFDVDDTLVMHGFPDSLDGAMDIVHPGTNNPHKVHPHKANIELLKQQRSRGYHVTVWSAGGWAWAKAVALGIESYVNEVRSKPIKYCDDLTDPKDILGTRVYLPYKES